MRTTLTAGFFAAVVGLFVSVAISAAEPAPAARKSAPPSRVPATRHDPHNVSVFVFNKDGKLVGPVESPKVVLSAAQWRQRLTAEQYKVLRAKDTEAPFCGDLLDNKKEGVYSCAACGLPLFSSAAKFDSGTGWPSFFKPVSEDNIETHADFALGIARQEVKCVRCKSHMGHVFDDGPAPTRLRFCLNSASLKFTEADELASIADPAAENFATKVGADSKHATTSGSAAAPREGKTDSDATTATTGGGDGGASATRESSKASKENDVTESQQAATAVFAGGCFWCTEAAFGQLRGVSDVQSGYAGGKAATATYEQVSRGNTGHAEAIRITYDPSKISYDQLLMVFFDAHDPTQLNRQGPDVGSQYRSAIFYSDPEQKKAAEAKIHELTEHKTYGVRKVVTKLEPLTEFFPAEAYHQDYVEHNPLQPYVAGHSIPKACSIQKRHPELIDPEKAVKPAAY